MNDRCRTCLYHSRNTDTCDYLLITNERRGCPTEGCTRYRSAKTLKELGKYYATHGGMSASDGKLIELYDRGLSDVEIAAFLGRSRTFVARRRKRFGLPSRKEMEGSSSED